MTPPRSTAPTTGAGPLADLDVVDRLGDDLRAAGYDSDAVLGLLGPAAHAAWSRGEPTSALRATTDGSALSTLVRVFLLGTTEPRSALAAALPRTGVDGALDAGALEPAADGVRAALDIRPHGAGATDVLLVSDLDSDVRPGPVRPDHVLGLGAASLTLARAVIREPVKDALDLGTGCGVQALYLAGHADRVVATDTNPRALALARATARINGQRWDLRRGSLFEPVAGDEFDLVVSNPPFVAGPGALRFSYRDSGLAGDEACRRIVTGVRERLRPGGTAQLLANWMIRQDTDWRSRVGAWVSASGCDAWVVQRDVADPAAYVGLWLADAGEREAAAGRRSDLADAWLDYFEAERVVGVGMGLVTLRRTDSTDPSVTLDEILDPDCDLTGHEVAGLLHRRDLVRRSTDRDLLSARWVLADAATVESRAVPGHEGWTTVLRLLRRPGGPGASVQLDEWGQALLAGCTGTVPVTVQLRLLAQAHAVPQDALTEAMLPMLRTAILRGLLVPAAA